MRRLCFLALVALAWAPPGEAQELGRLFFTPEQRAALDSRRRARVPDKPAPTPIAVSPITRLDGYVRRSEGPSTVWVNGTTLDDATPGRDQRVSVPIGDGGVRVRLRPGETLDRGSGEVRDLLGPNGELRVKAAK